MSISNVAVSTWIRKNTRRHRRRRLHPPMRIAVWILVRRPRSLGMSRQRIRDHYEPPLTQVDLDAAWNYYEQHPDEIELAIEENNEAD